MALSGKFETKIAGGSTGGYYIGVDWKVNSQSTTNNTSNVTASTYIRSTGSGYRISSSVQKNISITIDGTKYTGTNTIGIGTNTKKVLLTKTVDVKHTSDGTKTCPFACSVQIDFTLSGTALKTPTASGSGTFDKINLNTPPSMSGSLGISPSGTIAENVSTIALSWAKAADSQNNANKYQIKRYINGSLNKTIDIPNINTLSYSDTTVGSFGQGTSIYYTILAGDSFGTWSNTLKSSTVTKNTLTAATLASSSSIRYNTTEIDFTWSGAKNTFTGTNSTAFDYTLTADGVTIHRNTLTGTSLKIQIVDSAPASGAYILKNDLKNKFAGSSYNGNLTFTLKTANKFGSSKTTSKTIPVDLRSNPKAPTVSISEDPLLSTALKEIASTKNKYFIPNGTDKIRISWSGASDALGTALKYEVQVKLGSGAYESKKTDLTTSYYDLVLPKQTVSQQISVRVYAKTAYNYSSYADAPAKTLHFYNPPSVDNSVVNRTDTTASVDVYLKANTSIPNINFTTRTYSGASSGTLTNTTEKQTITASNLNGGNKYNWTITVLDDTGLHTTNVVKTIEIPAYTPLFSVREKGVGVNCIPNGKAALMVNGGLIIDGKTLLDLMYPVGAIYMSANSTNPSSLFGGTWVAWGAGRVPVGIDSGQSEFNTVEKTGGAKTHTLTVAQMPSHTHTQNAHNHTQNAHTHTQNAHTHKQNAHSHSVRYRGFSMSSSTSGNLVLRRNESADPYDGTDSDAAHSTTATNQNATATNNNTTATNNATTATNQNTGGGQAHNNLQPYIVCYMWKRTA